MNIPFLVIREKQMKTLSNTQFFSSIFAIIILAALAVIGPAMYLSGNLALVERQTFASSVPGISKIDCEVVEHRGMKNTFTSIKARGGDGPFFRGGHITIDTEKKTYGSSTEVGSWGYVSYGPYAEGHEDDGNPLAWACQKAASKSKRFTNLL